MRINRFLENELNSILSGYSFKDQADLFLNSRFKKNRLGKRDRNWVRERFFFYIRHKLLFDELETCGISGAETIAMVFDNEPDEKLSVIIEDLKKNGKYDALFNRSFPDFLTQRITDIFGEDAFEWFNSKAGTVIRANLLKISRQDLMSELLNDGCDVESTPFSPAGILVKSNGSNLKNSQLFNDGDFEFQDESSQLTALLSNRSGTMLDFCAGGGGKSLAAASFFPNLKITASDIREHIFQEILSRSKRAGAHISIKKSFPDQQFDTVFVDAPCSGSGVLRRNPADRWIIGETMVADLNKTQLEILENAKNFVSPGGELIYVTCSFLKEENEKIVEKFINKNKSFSVFPAFDRLSANIPDLSESEEIIDGIFFRVSPGYQRDLMFGAIIKNKA